jgi:TorA maturation chaperone TorD
MTPHELSIHIDEYLDREKYMQKERITAAYLGALWERVKKMPDLQKIFDNEPQEEKNKDQAAADMLAEVTRLNAAFGGTVV